MSLDPLHHIEKTTKDMNTFMGEQTKGVFQRYPLIFSLLVVFGIVAVLHGFESIISYIPYFEKHPAIVFLIGLAILVFTGSLYKKLDRKIE